MLRSDGEPITMADALSGRRPPTDQDTTAIWQQAMAAYRRRWDALSSTDRERFVELPCIECGDPLPDPGSTWTESVDATEYLLLQSEALALCEQASQLGGLAAFPRDNAQGDIFMAGQSEHLGLFRLVELRTAVDLHGRQPERAAQSLEVLFTLLKSTENQPMVNSAGYQIKMRSGIYRLLSELCVQPQVSSETIRLFQSKLTRDKLSDSLRWSFASERAYAVEAYFRYPTSPGRVAYALERHGYLDMMEELTATCEIGWPEIVRYSLDTEAAPRFGVLNDHACRSFKLLMVSGARSESTRRLTLVVLAARLFATEHDRLPESIDELVPNFIDEIPKDVSGSESLSLDVDDGNEVTIACLAPTHPSDARMKQSTIAVRFRIASQETH